MTEENDGVSELLPDEPFLIGGGLKLVTGRDVFVPLDMHKRLLDDIRRRSIQKVSIRGLAGPVGIGRTWTLSWVARQAIEENMDTDERWDAALVPGLGSGEMRNLIESIFKSTEYIRDEMADQIEQEFVDYGGTGSDEEVLMRHAIHNRESWSVLIGNRGRFPSISQAQGKPKWTNRDTQIEFLTLWLEEMNEFGVDNLIIIIDEFEKLALRLSPSKITDLSDGLRHIYDEIEPMADEMPSTQILLSATADAANRIDPTVTTEQLSGWLEALQSRMDDSFWLGKINEEEAEMIAERTIDVRRTKDLDDRFAPYTQEAIHVAYEGADGLPRRFAELLNKMHFNAYNEESITADHAEEAISELGYGAEQVV